MLHHSFLGSDQLAEVLHLLRVESHLALISTSIVGLVRRFALMLNGALLLT